MLRSAQIASALHEPLPALRFGSPLVSGTSGPPPVLLLHGQPGRASVWRQVGDELATRGLHALAIDRPGYGRSQRPAVGFGGNADAIIEFLDHHGIERVTVVAHSWAGAVALALAAAAPDRVQSMVLLAPVGGRGSVNLLDRLLALPVVGWGALRGGLRMGAWLLDRDLTRRLLPAGFGDLEPMAAKRMAGAAQPLNARRSAAVEQQVLVNELAAVRTGLSGVLAPTLVMAGSHDLIVPTAASRALADEMPDARFDLVDAGHLLPSEVPGLIADAVERMQALDLVLPVAPVSDDVVDDELGDELVCASCS